MVRSLVAPRAGPRFDRPVARGGYAWWYLDALSDDGRHGLTVIGFVGSVFSPYYAFARRRAAARGALPPDPLAHCAINVVLYAASGKRWAMTERGHAGVARDASTLRVGPSAMCWDGDSLTVHVDETTVPVPRRIRGTIRLHPAALLDRAYPLDARGRHGWCPIAPCARVEVALTAPDARWSGPGYLDSNAGDVPLERDFARWDWSRAALPDGSTAVLYDVTRTDGSGACLAMRFDAQGRGRPFETPPPADLPATLWRVARGTRSDAADDPARAPRILRTFEDTPFYARSLLSSRLMGEPVTAVHESLSLERFASPWVQAMLPFRMPRRRR